MPTFNANVFGAVAAAIIAFAVTATGTWIDYITRPTGDDHSVLMFIAGFMAIPVGAGMGAFGLLTRQRVPWLLGFLGLAALAFTCGLSCVAFGAALWFTGWMWLLSSLLGASGAAMYFGGLVQADAKALACNPLPKRHEV